MAAEEMAHNGFFSLEIDEVAADELVIQRDDLEQWEQTFTDASVAFVDVFACQSGERWMPATGSGNVTLKSATLWAVRALVGWRARKVKAIASLRIIFIADASLTKGQSPEALGAILNYGFIKLIA